MDHKILFTESVCNCSQQTMIGGILTLLLVMLIDCCYTSRLNNRIQELDSENKTLKNVILTTVDRALVRLIKNGNDPDSSDQE